MKRLGLLLGSLLVLSACNNDPADLVPDTVPNVAIASVNNLDARDVDGALLIPASQMFDPETGGLINNPFPIAVTASDERQIYEVALILSQGTETGSEDIVYSEVGREILTLQEDEAIFGNPFIFSVPFDLAVAFEGTASGVVPAQLEVIAKDNAGQVNDRFVVEALVDGSLPFLEVNKPEGPQKGTIALFGEAYDQESGILETRIFIDTEERESEVAFGGRSFAATIDTTELAEGRHSVLVYTRNGVNEISSTSFEIIVQNEEEEDPAPEDPAPEDPAPEDPPAT